MTHALVAYPDFCFVPFAQPGCSLDSSVSSLEAAMLSFFKHMILHRSAPTAAKAELDYLHASVSLADLERRQREIEHGLFRCQSVAF